MLQLIYFFSFISIAQSNAFWVENIIEKAANHPPSDIFLSNNVILNPAIGGDRNMVVGVLRTEDPDIDDEHVYSMPYELTQNKYFVINRDEIQIRGGYWGNLSPGNYEITVFSSDGEFSVEKTFTVTSSDELFHNLFSYGIEVTNYRIVGIPTPSIPNGEFVPGEYIYGTKYSTTGSYYFPGDMGIHYDVYEFHRNLGNQILQQGENFKAGTGYWFIVTEDYGGVELPRHEPVHLNNRGEFEMELQAGWNLIGNPFRENLDWDEELNYNILEGNFLAGEVSRVYSYEGAYNLISTLSIYQGGFVKASKDVTVYLRKSGYFSNVPNENLSTREDFDLSDGWQLDIAMSNSEQTTNLGGIGMRKIASEGIDVFDIESPPPPSDEFAFEWEDDFGLFRNIVETQESYTWEYQVKTNQKEVKLSWDREKAALLNKELWIELLPQGRFVNLNLLSEVKYRPASNQRIKLYYGILPEMYQVEVFPNPTKSEATIMLNSSFEGLASIQVTDIEGKQILKDSKKVSSGQNQWTWDLMDSAGRRISPGLYFYNVRMNGREDKVLKLIIH